MPKDQITNEENAEVSYVQLNDDVMNKETDVQE